jgi:hypothetical protein
MVAQEAFDLLAAEAFVKVQLARLFNTAASLRLGAAVGMGLAETRIEAVLRTSPRAVEKLTIFRDRRLLKRREGRRGDEMNWNVERDI